ncbi:hypothetical protein [Streptomyces flavidovirens]
MPLDYQAFREQTHSAYLDYAHVRLGGRDEAAEAVAAAYDDLAVIWMEALRSARTPALAWLLLDRAVCARTRARVGVCPRGRSRLAGAVADVRILHYRLGLSIEMTADLIGADVHVVQALLFVVDREAPETCSGCTGRAAHPPGSVQKRPA